MTTVEAIDNRWTEITKALLLGFVALNVLLHQAYVGGVTSPDGASQLMMWVAVVGIVGYAALRPGLTLGYWVSFLTGILSLVFMGVIGSGTLGSFSGPNPAVIGIVLGPVAILAYALVLIVSTYVALRERGRSEGVLDTGGEGTADAQ